MSRETSGGSKRKIAAAAAVVTAVLAALTGLFLRTVREQLWQQSIRTILESTQQGCLTLQVQLEDEYRMLGRVAVYLSGTGGKRGQPAEGLRAGGRGRGAVPQRRGTPALRRAGG